MKQLTGLDAAFLALETPSVYGHVGSVSILEPSPGRPLTLERVTSLIESRLHQIPPFRRRLMHVPLGLDQPYWIEDPDFDIEFHVREIALPTPGDMAQLTAQCARLHARPLDRTRPLWETYLIHGLEGGLVGLYTKVHHAAIDGISGNDILTALVDLSPDGREPKDVPDWTPEPEPSTAIMLRRSASTLVGHPGRAARLAAEVARSLPSVATNPRRRQLPVVDRLVLRRGAELPLNRSTLRAPTTPFNALIGPHRRWAFCSIPLADAKAVKNAVGGTVNDVVMALCTAGLRAWLESHDALPTAPLVAGVPVSVRTEGPGEHGNHVALMMAPLPTDLADPLARLQECHAAMLAAKDQFEALPASLIADVTQFAMPAIANQASRLAALLRLQERANPFNLIISNVPGPDIPLFLAGARLRGIYPLSAIAQGQGLNITVLGLGGQLHFGVIADRDLVPDVEVICDAIVEEMATLVERAAATDVRRLV